MKTTTADDGLVWVIRIGDLQARAHVEGCQAIKDGGKFVALRTTEEKRADQESNDPDHPEALRYDVQVCRCAR